MFVKSIVWFKLNILKQSLKFEFKKVGFVCTLRVLYTWQLVHQVKIWLHFFFCYNIFSINVFCWFKSVRNRIIILQENIIIKIIRSEGVVVFFIVDIVHVCLSVVPKKHLTFSIVSIFPSDDFLLHALNFICLQRRV